MLGIITGSIIISLLHAIIPSHWLPVLAIGRQQQWTLQEVMKVTFITAFAHASSTVGIGLVLAFIGHELSGNIASISHYAAPAILLVMGLVFIYRHHRHKHFHVSGGGIQTRTKRSIIISLSIAMSLSPCMEIEAYFLLAGTMSKWLLLGISLVYFFVTITGMVLLVQAAYKGLLKFSSHKLEHNAGIITGITLIATGILSFFIH